MSIWENIKQWPDRLKLILQVMTGVGAVLTTLSVGWIAYDKWSIDRNAKIISHEVVKSAREELDPLRAEEFYRFRELDSLEKAGALAVAVAYMDKTDSLIAIIGPQLVAMNARLARMEAKQRADTATTRDRQLAEIWRFLQHRERADSSAQQLEAIMEEIRAGNRARLEAIRTKTKPAVGGDRVQ